MSLMQESNYSYRHVEQDTVKLQDCNIDNQKQQPRIFYRRRGRTLNPLSVNKEQTIRSFCPYCQRIFFSPGNLKRHIEIHLLDRKNYECHLCHKRFSWKNTLNTHLRREHRIIV